MTTIPSQQVRDFRVYQLTLQIYKKMGAVIQGPAEIDQDYTKTNEDALTFLKGLETGELETLLQEGVEKDNPIKFLLQGVLIIKQNSSE